MSRIIATLICFGLLLSAVRAEDVPPKSKSPDLRTTRDQASYAIGQNIGESIKNDGLDVNTAALIQGLTDALSNSPAKLTPEQMRAAMDTFRRELQTKMAEKARLDGERNRKEGVAFLTANKSKPGVVTLPSGLQYVVLKAGKGPSPKKAFWVKWHGTEGKVLCHGAPWRGRAPR